MLNLPGGLTPDSFLEHHWQREPLFMAGALGQIGPSISRNELGWLATLEDVESRIVFVDRSQEEARYSAEQGPFDSDYLAQLPPRDWTLLIHDVEKHLPAMRALFRHVAFIPDWRIDDLMVSFAAPGGGVGPHVDNYDVFLCQGAGVRNWKYTTRKVAKNPEASTDLALLDEFDDGDDLDAVAGDVLYLPPGCAHWGTAKRACTTYSIGMRAPQISDLSTALNLNTPESDDFFQDSDLSVRESRPGYISTQATSRAAHLLGLPESRYNDIATALGRFATEPKDWLRPEIPAPDIVEVMLERLGRGHQMEVHGMARIAFDERQAYCNGHVRLLGDNCHPVINAVCARRAASPEMIASNEGRELVEWLVEQGGFDAGELD